jgi:hypothetical protein
LFEYLLRDIRNTERFGRRDSVIALHDCLPVNFEMAEREHRPEARTDPQMRFWWTGDVWKILPILAEYRPDMRIMVLDCQPTALVLLTNLDPDSGVLRESYHEITSRYLPLTLEDYGFDRLRSEISIMDSRALYDQQQLSRLLGRG